MTAIQDFTSIPVGTLVLLEGRVEACPRCGRNGIEHRFDDLASYFVHRQHTEMLCDGLLVEPDDSCPAPGRGAGPVA